ncbi:hypothetical protein ACFQY4_08265 [Catellatospora bangladeshensis]|uniref:Uncharacterized protein n=1 Tax=Catellatospora bangladeshensis TaxID=310355 RepID=A0A8J3JIN0_9ACTN|nr:hypothetical protein [Catellatospora bangladeshensis]GIF78844.1 hypothetical protein Cba03nite_01930 [Catellatospora bangladeshensis]
MRRLLGLLFIAYGFLLAVNTTFPLVADLSGERVTAGPSGDSTICSARLLAPPLAGIYSNCDASWLEGAQRVNGRLVGADVAEKTLSGTEVEAAIIEGMDGYAFLPPTGLERVAGFAAPLVVIFGLVLLFAPRKRRRRGRSHGHHGDHDHDDDDYGDSDDGGGWGDSGGDSGGGDGGGGGD